MITWFSLFSAIVFYSIALLSVFALRRRTGFLKKYGVSVLLFVTALALVRLLLPLDFTFSHVLISWTFLPAVVRYFRACPWAGILLLAVWGIGAVVVLVKDFFSLLHASAICKNYTIVEDERIRQIAGDLSINCPVLVSPEVPVPYVAGLFLHTIYLPVMDVSDRGLELILLHEAQHIRSHDAQIKLLFGLLAAVFWWNPVVWLFRREIDTLLELRCDAKVTKFMGVAERGEYIAALLDTMKHTVNPRPARLWSAAVNSSSAFQQRFAVLLDHMDGKPQRMNTAVKCCLITAFFASYLVIWQPFAMPPSEEVGEDIYVSTSPSGIREEFLDISKINSDTSYIFKKDGWYELVINGLTVWKFRDLSSVPYKDLEVFEGVKGQ